MSQNPPFTIISFEQTDMLNDTGDDIVFFHVDLEINKESFHCMVPFYKLQDHLAKNKPADADYFSGLRSSITGFGPKHTAMLSLAAEEGYDIEKAVMEYIGTGNIFDKLTPNKKLSDIEHANLTEQLKQVELLAQEGKPFNLRDITFKDAAMDLLNKKILEIYPEILNSRPEYITELKSLLINHVLKFGEAVNNLAWRAYKES